MYISSCAHDLLKLVPRDKHCYNVKLPVTQFFVKIFPPSMTTHRSRYYNYEVQLYKEIHSYVPMLLIQSFVFHKIISLLFERRFLVHIEPSEPQKIYSNNRTLRTAIKQRRGRQH